MHRKKISRYITWPASFDNTLVKNILVLYTVHNLYPTCCNPKEMQIMLLRTLIVSCISVVAERSFCLGKQSQTVWQEAQRRCTN